MNPKILIISVNLGEYDSQVFDAPADSTEVQVLRIEDSNIEERLYNANSNTIVCSIHATNPLKKRIISRVPKINPIFLFSSDINPPSIFPCSKDLLSSLREILEPFDYLVWIDGNCRIKSIQELKNLCLYIPSNGWGIYTHPDRSCLFTEAKCAKGLGYVNNDILNAQITYYKNQGIPRNYGLYACGFFIRSRQSLFDAQDLWEFWLDEFFRWVPRDQLSLPYCLFHKPRHRPTVLGRFSWNNSVFSFIPHHENHAI